MAESNIRVYVTNDPDQFRKLVGNRDVKGEDKIIKSIDKVGYVPSPILVNEKMEVIDGQNRLGACAKLGLPIYYIIVGGLGIEHCRALNIGQTNWAVIDYIESYAAMGNESYRRLLSLINEFKKELYKEVPIMCARPSYMGSGAKGFDTKKIKNGDFEMTEKDYELARTRMRSMLNIGFYDYAKAHDLSARAYWTAVIYAYVHQGVDVKRLIKKLNESSVIVPSCTRTVDTLRFFDEIYNKGTKKADTKVFMAADFQKRKYL